ncbi:hypothetical protein ACFO25_14895 [Paenactinomyces guangxiensis]|uniref:Uncharacterized protein n=1 Tax=Paenactinomyces guangxiensis TaxID=1490290 RepID=A0A7W1WPT9_9BACL|nr:hypothetical protein [Paenactinomyces guangxiensis]MBA4493853.1 hypothetical protein [Paenactinomyces guangxiensis]MBH8591319.1 hypothetical protein [Paenactinomyces guangxiensis]
MSTKNSFNSTDELEFHRTSELEAEYTTIEDDLETDQWEELADQEVEFFQEKTVTTGRLNSNVLDKFNEESFDTDPFNNNSKWENTPLPVSLELEENWEEDAWLERWRLNPEKYLVTALPPELSQRLEESVRERKMKRNEFVLKALEEACRQAELDKIRRKGLAEGEPAKLIKDPQTGKYRCFPSDFFTEEELYGFEVIEGKYYQKLWEKAEKGWVQVNKGYFEAVGEQDSPYIKMENNKPVGGWEVYPFDFFEHDWKWGIYDNSNVVIEVVGRKEGDAPLMLDIYVDNELVDSVQTSREVHRVIMQYHR